MTKKYVYTMIFFVELCSNLSHAANDFSISNRVYRTDNWSYQLGLLKEFGSYELENGINFPGDASDNIDFSIGANRMFDMTERTKLVFGAGYGFESPYVKYAYRYEFNASINIEGGYSYYFQQNENNREQLYLGFSYSFCGNGDAQIVTQPPIPPKPNNEISINVDPVVLEKKSFIINFSFNNIKTTEFQPLRQNLNVIKSSKKITVTGHADSLGRLDVNKKVSYFRAKFVSDWLIENGVDKTKIIIRNEGESSPIDSNSTVIGRAKNRRVEVVFMVPKT